MPAPAVYVLAVVSAVGAAVAFKHFVYDPHLAPMLEQWAEDYIAHRRAQRQRQSPIAVPATIRLRRRGDLAQPSDSNNSSSDSEDDSKHKNSFNRTSRKNDNSSSSATKIGDFGSNHTRDVNQWRSEVEHSQRTSSLRHRLNRAVRPVDQSINSIPNPTMPTRSPTHVIFDNSTSAPTTPTATLASVASSPPPQVSSIGTPQSITSGSTILPHVTDNDPTIGSSQVLENHIPRLASPTSLPVPDHHSPPTISSPIPSLSQSYPQELDRERGVELLSPPSSGTSSPFTTFSPLAVPQPLSPFAVVQPFDQGPDPFADFDRWSDPHTPSRALSPSQPTASSSHYQSFPTSPTPLRPSPLDINYDPHTHNSSEELSQLSSPSPVNFTSPNALSPRSPHSNLSDPESMTDLDAMSDFGSDGSGGSWAEVSSAFGSANRH